MKVATIRDAVTGLEVRVRVRRRGAKRSRVIFDDGHAPLVSTADLTFLDEPNLSAARESHTIKSRVVPITPLRRFYAGLRKLTGNPEAKFDALRSRLADRSEAREVGNVDLVAELFIRSQMQMHEYANAGEGFYPHELRMIRTAQEMFANKLVDLLDVGDVKFGCDADAFGFVDYEINPLRTTRSCWENGKPATSSGAGGMDLLLTSSSEGVALPAVGEIKASTEQVGPTFALIQTLTYAAELVTPNQWERLKRHHPLLESVCNADTEPRVDIIVILQGPYVPNEDLQYAQALAGSLSHPDQIGKWIRTIRFFVGNIVDDIAHFELIS